jgi:hypothetical protein
MTDKIEGCDISHWQSTPNFVKGYNKGLRFAGIKVSQGINYEDDKAAINNAHARAAGFQTFPYHFFTTDPAKTQYEWFAKCINKIGASEFTCAPAVDYEFYNQTTMATYQAMNCEDFCFPYGASKLGVRVWMMTLGLVIPSSSQLYSILNLLRGWQGHPAPAIYTNRYVADAYLINSSTYNWSQFLLWYALWNATTIVKPKSWANEELYIHQDYVIQDAREWGVDGAMDHDYWGTKLPFPGTPVPPVVNEYQYSGYVKELNKTLTGTLKEV